ncbi:glycosyltransferase family 2 protein [Leptolyngbya sp. NK1-12]|uniref:Glycosyltransferase family 2 protein n=1 Tax=Leptolyngbya sp. NK1-12 TaxID=2547451 RepID=A0AA96WQP9_9CYAN|nr:glycosyltransferase family 2 protein [Leptolyngbya sp. NK1-12]WNZ27296.1 glycosyltransferase family 2 protein [Leptolyngbya sp. NK1-12]
MPKVSVIVPNYNHAQFLEQRLQSILDQTYQDFELIYLDDASTDNSNEVFAQFADHPKIRSILNTTNSGSPFKQWNKGIQHSTGEYIWIAESDDFAESTFLETLVPILDNHPNVGIAYCQSRQVDEHNQLKDTMHWWTDDVSKERWRQDFFNNGLDECRNYLSLRNTVPNASAVLTRKQLFEKVGYAYEPMFLCGDWMTWIKLLLESDVFFTAKILNYYRTHNSSVRSKPGAGSRVLHEQMQVFAFLHEQVAIPFEITEIKKDEFASYWLILTLLHKEKIKWKQTIDLYRLAKSFDPFIELRLLKRLKLHGARRYKRKLSQALLSKV